VTVARAYLALAIDARGCDTEALEAECFAAGALAVTYTDLRDDPILEPAPGEFRLWPATQLQALFAAEDASAPLLARLAANAGIPLERIAVSTLADRPWERDWRATLHARRFGRRLWVCPLHEQVSEPGAAVVRLDPGLAFGTGEHPTTALCLRWLDAHLAPQAEVIDYGCGSGILAIAAVKLGARRAHAFDIDPQALEATRDNAARNGVSSALVVCDSDAQLPPRNDVVVANILAGPLCALAPRFIELVRPGGSLVLAGLLAWQVPQVTQAQSSCFDIAPFGSHDGWIGLAGTRIS
jgi:ribosomal protein L11 methyltransferase